jgi:hypothetical protein
MSNGWLMLTIQKKSREIKNLQVLSFLGHPKTLDSLGL